MIVDIKIYRKILLYLISFLPPALVTGPFLPDLFVVLSGFILLFICWKRKLWIMFNNNFTKFFILFYIYLIVNSLFSNQVLYSLETSFPFIRFLFLIISIKYLADTEKNFYKIFFCITLFTIVFLFLDSTFEFLLGWHWLFDKNTYPEFFAHYRISSLFDEEYILGSFFVRIYPIFLCLFLYFMNKISKKNIFGFNYFYFIFFINILFLFPILYSGERLSIFMYLAINILICINFKNILKSIYFIVFLIFLTFLIIFNNEVFFKRFISHTYHSFTGKLESKINSETNMVEQPIKTFKIFSSEHQSHVIIAYNMFLDRPILGHGIRMYRKVCETPKYYLGERSCTTHPHNILAQFISELGIVGFLFYLFFFIWILYKFFIIFYFPIISNIFEKVLLSSILVYIFPLAPAGNFFNNWMEIIFFLPLGFYLSKNNFYK